MFSLVTLSSWKPHCGGSQRRNVSSDLDAVDTSFAAHMHMEDTAASHFGALLTDEARAGGTRNQLMTHHVGGERPGGTASRWVL